MVYRIRGQIFQCQIPRCESYATTRITTALDGHGFDLCRAHLQQLSEDIQRHQHELGEAAACEENRHRRLGAQTMGYE